MALTQTAADRFRALNNANTNGYETNFSLDYVAQGREVYASELSHLHDVARAQHAGVIEVALRTRTGTVVVPVDSEVGMEITTAIQEMIGNKLLALQRNILNQLAEAENEKADQEGMSERAQVFALCMPQGPATMKALPSQATIQQSEVA